MKHALSAYLREVFVPPPGRAAAVDGVRALAILIVIAFHCVFLAYYVLDGTEAVRAYVAATPAWLVWAWNGDKGVDMFFVLSGFLITRALLREFDARDRVDYPRFIRNRLLRIVPLYIVVLVLAVAIGMPNREYFWANLLFVNNLLDFERMLIPWSWSVTVEMQFYLLAPLLAWLIHRAGGRAPLWFAGLILAGVLTRGLLLLNNPEYVAVTVQVFLHDKVLGFAVWDALYVNLYTRAGPLVLGMAVAWIVERRAGAVRTLYARHPQAFNAAVVAALVLSALMLNSPLMLVEASDGGIERLARTVHWLAGRDLFALGVAVALVAALLGLGVGRPIDRFLSLRVWFPIAQVSYSVYFLHIFFIGAAYHLLHGETRVATLGFGTLAVVFGFTLIGAFMMGVASFVLIERPFLGLKRSARPAVAGTVARTEAA
ncbi:MAG: acyltransferase family protein [Gammaproteobacteria bacterium]